MEATARPGYRPRKKFYRKQPMSTILLKDLFAGSIAGMTTVFIAQPIDLVKIRLQKQSLTNPIYNGAWHCAKSIKKYEGGLAFYKGTTAPLIGSCFTSALSFGVNAAAKRNLKAYNKKVGKQDPDSLSVPQFMLCGGTAGFAKSFIATPVEHIRILLQLQTNEIGNNGKFSGTFDAAKTIYNRYGMKMVYRGYKVTCLREIIASSASLGGYEIIKSRTCDKTKPPNILWLMCIGAISGEIYWLVSYPLDVVKTKIQSDLFQTPIYTSIFETFKLTHQHEGIRGFYKGITPCLIRTVFTSSVFFGIFEFMIKIMAPYGPALSKKE